MRRHASVIRIDATNSRMETLVARIEECPANASIYLIGDEVPAISYPYQVGSLTLGAKILIDIEPLALGLGTGGAALVVSQELLPEDTAATGEHIVKARYTPTQYICRAAADHDGIYHDCAQRKESAQGLPVVVAGLHSALPAIIAALRASITDPRIVYIHTDWGALPLFVSKSLDKLIKAGWINTTITVGQSYGGDIEAITVAEALIIAAGAYRADIAIIAPGPGTVGTGTPFGYTCLDQAWALQQCIAVGADPVFTLRVSSADRRDRHRGLSHHSLTIMKHFMADEIDVALPDIDTPFWRFIAESLTALPGQHKLVQMCDLSSILATSPVALQSMTRSWQQDPEPFEAAVAAGLLAARKVGARRQ